MKKGLSLVLSQHGMRVPVGNMGWMSQKQEPAGMNHHPSLPRQVELSLAEPDSSYWRLHTLFPGDSPQGN